MEMSAKIKMLRNDLGMTLEEVGNIVGVGKSTVRKWENGLISNMRRDKIAKLAEALHTTPAYLMGWEEKKISDPTLLLNDQDVKLIKNFKKLNDTGKNKVIDYAEDLSSNPQYQIPSPVSHFAENPPLLFAASAEDRSPENIALMESEFDDFDDI